MTGLFGFSTYTRWSFILIGVSELLLALGPLRYSHTYLILSQIAFGNSLLVTFVSYTFLVPGVVFIRTDSSHDTERALLTSATAHIMHLANAVVCFLEWRYLSKIPAVVQSSFHVTAPTPTGCFMSTTISDSLRAKLLFDCTYVTFALTFVTTHGIVFYPFLNPHNPSTPIAILVLIAVAVGLWVCCRKVVTSLHGPQSKMTKHA
ncbi:hypothetical protein SARC_14481 [Sphaeroforma arctica JP610]|uniref:Uncharacterized protein n=1 Tax=Sphaeroforma arctica JP610 TaxID=667725 RepID=A0A0L0F8B3_9EUKA|nr:hypothetical protein SARC_14481 [Sphaeroforma arctica JP610]KNC72955.1 hypothetical protein SARC_14481 [Sphaeroforma arctica JP610]|eukprot:XP_014146857.1 hypothetical protein SARC_14481 [Sphaeroforma arctica JP610]